MWLSSPPSPPHASFLHLPLHNFPLTLFTVCSHTVLPSCSTGRLLPLAQCRVVLVPQLLTADTAPQSLHYPQQPLLCLSVQVVCHAVRYSLPQFLECQQQWQSRSSITRHHSRRLLSLRVLSSSCAAEGWQTTGTARRARLGSVGQRHDSQWRKRSRRRES